MADINGDGLDNTISGTSNDDRIWGLGGNDNLKGLGGNDQLFGGDGNDSLHGDAGVDIMFGGAGNDTYYVEETDDITSEETVAGIDDGGTDRVYSTVSYALARFIERATLIGTAVANLIGNTQDNVLVGNGSANTLTGGAGKDTLTGGGGVDTFALGPADATSTDKVTDYAADDFIGVNAADFGLALGAGLVLDGAGNQVLDPEYFAAIAGSTNTQGTAAGHGQFLFNTTTAALLWDQDGSGTAAGVSLATFNAGASLGASSFKILGSAPPVIGSISISDVSITEGNSGTKIMTFTVSRSAGTAAFTVNFATADGTATVAGGDYVSANGQLAFAENQASQTISIVINGDVDLESDETVLVNLTGASGGAIVDGQGIGTIVNDDGPAAVVGNISINDVTISEGNSGAKLATFTVSRTGTAAFDVDFATANGTAFAGSDFLAAGGTLNFSANQSSRTVSVTINGDTLLEPDENFVVNLSGATNGGTIVDGQGVGAITNDDSSMQVVRITDLRSVGAPDPAGIAYVPGQGLFVSDSEVDETPFSRSNNMFKLTLDGSFVDQFDLRAFTREPTGLAYDGSTNRLYISDDDLSRVFWVNPGNPTVTLGQINLATSISGVAIDAEDIAINRTNGNLFIVNGTSRSIVELTSAGAQVGSAIILPTIISDPEALLYDQQNDVFYVGGGFSSSIWKVNRQGVILETIDILANYRNPVSNTRVHVKDLEFAPTSDLTDDPLAQSLYVLDYGNTHLSAVKSNDGRLFEIDIGAPDFIV